jgi:hypothetical protein
VKRALVLVVIAACGTARNADTYRADTQKLLASHEPALKKCYDSALESDAKAAGMVAVHFTVKRKTGAVTHAALDKKGTTAPDAVGDCVLEAVRGLTLAPADRHDGNATFVYEFKPPA